MDRVANKSFVRGDSDDCRWCGQTLYWAEGDGGTGRWMTKKIMEPVTWNFVYENRDLWACGENGAHLPKHWCWVDSSDGRSVCGRPVKYEDIVSELFVCGRHRQRGEADKKHREALRKMKEQREAEEARYEFEATQYEECLQWIIDNGYESLVKGYTVRERWRSSINRILKVDLFDLKAALERSQECDTTASEESESDAMEESWLSMLDQDTST